MKRCPQCEFIFPERDDVCDFDQTPLVSATESEIAAITNTPVRPALAELAATHSKKFEERRNRRALPLAVALGLILGLVTVAAYFAVHRRTTSSPPEVATARPVAHSFAAPSPVLSPVAGNSPSPELLAGDRKSQPSEHKVSSAQLPTRVSPVSAGPPRTEASLGRKPVILLTTGGKIEADAAWRTKDGVWYRRNGIVTLLKGNRVKGILGQ